MCLCIRFAWEEKSTTVPRKEHMPSRKKLGRQRKESLCLRIPQYLDTTGQDVLGVFGNYIWGAVNAEKLGLSTFNWGQPERQWMHPALSLSDSPEQWQLQMGVSETRVRPSAYSSKQILEKGRSRIVIQIPVHTCFCLHTTCYRTRGNQQLNWKRNRCTQHLLCKRKNNIQGN